MSNDGLSAASSDHDSNVVKWYDHVTGAVRPVVNDVIFTPITTWLGVLIATALLINLMTLAVRIPFPGFMNTNDFSDDCKHDLHDEFMQYELDANLIIGMLVATVAVMIHTVEKTSLLLSHCVNKGVGTVHAVTKTAGQVIQNAREVIEFAFFGVAELTVFLPFAMGFDSSDSDEASFERVTTYSIGLTYAFIYLALKQAHHLLNYREKLSKKLEKGETTPEELGLFDRKLVALLGRDTGQTNVEELGSLDVARSKRASRSKLAMANQIVGHIIETAEDTVTPAVLLDVLVETYEIVPEYTRLLVPLIILGASSSANALHLGRLYHEGDTSIIQKLATGYANSFRWFTSRVLRPGIVEPAMVVQILIAAFADTESIVNGCPGDTYVPDSIAYFWVPVIFTALVTANIVHEISGDASSLIRSGLTKCFPGESHDEVHDDSEAAELGSAVNADDLYGSTFTT